ncbi:MAG: hypothetical protein Q8R30_05130 [bacterium]|nr:hypothetical protein [bacterium]MDZ4285741.1 hypothetical protein [Candidatus Sungbacteria bacterium]
MKRTAFFVVFLGVVICAMAACSMEPQGQELKAKDVEAIQNMFAAQRDVLLRSVEGFGDYEIFITGYKEQHGVEPSASIIADLEVGRKRRLLKDAAEYSHLLGINASMGNDFMSAIAFFEEAIRYDPTNGSYKEELTEARKLVKKKKR